MGDSETLVAKTSIASDNSAVDYNDASMKTTETGAAAVETNGDFAAPATATAEGDLVTSAGSVENTDPATYTSNVDAGGVAAASYSQQVPTAMAYDTNVSMDASQYGAYESSLNGNSISETGNAATAGISENGISHAGVIESTALHQLVDDSVLTAEEQRLWSIVTANSLDFNAWTSLIEETERTSEANILKIRKVYDAFLAEFPLCYGYWKKYADHEARLSSVDKVEAVYERAVQGVTYSVDMWLHYCVFSISTYGDPETIRRLFERGLAYVGTDYQCFPLWDKYLEYEISQQDWPRVATIYTRILEIPNQQLDRYFEGFKELVASRPLSELRTPEEAAATSEADGNKTEGEDPANAAEQTSKPVSASLKDAEELEKYIAVREELYKKAKEFDSKIIGFETAIRRPYFHVRPLNVAELENWHNYLDFIEGVGDFNKVVKLYERCLVACANYPDYWIRYVLCMEASGSMELADNALARATQVFVKRQPEIHLFAARFREQHGDISGARAAYQLVHAEISPGLMEAIIRHANMEHRLGNLEDACSLYEQSIAIEKGKEHSQTLPMLFAQYSRFLYLVTGKVEKPREILDKAVEDIQLSKPLLEALIHLESIQSLPKRIDYLDSLVHKFIVPNTDSPNVSSIAEREELSSIFLEFLDLFGDAQSIKEADERHFKLFLRHRSTSESKKRHAEDYLSSDRTKLARSVTPSSTPSVVGAFPNTHSQWPASYGVQPQAWPQATQTQVPQWNPGYAQQPAYGGYGTYGTNYAPQQVPTSVPQSAAYGTYPPTYSAQAFPQQSYPQPAAAATLTPPAQPAAVPPASYYGSYY